MFYDRVLIFKILAILFVVWQAFRVFSTRHSRKLKHVPGPWITNYSGWPLKVNVIRGRRIHYIHALHEKYGPVVRIGPSEVSVASVEGFREIHRIGGGYLESKWYESFAMGKIYTLFTLVDPKKHAMRRKSYSRSFSANSLRDNWEAIVEQKVQTAVSQIHKDALNGNADVLKWWTLMATDVIAHLSFGESFGMLEKGEKNEYIRALELALFSDGIRAELPLVHSILRNSPFERVRSMFRPDENIMRYGKKAVENARVRQTTEVSNLFTKILHDADEAERQDLDDVTLNWEAFGLIIAGSDTTAVTLTYLLWVVLKNPSLQRRLEEEVAQLDEHFKDKDVEKLPLLNAVIDETLRLYGAAPGSLPRIVPPSGSIINDCALPAGTVVNTQAFDMHRLPSVFPDPNSFQESRFLNREKLTSDQKAAFCPFGAGTRKCVGIHLAEMELRLATATFFRRCRGATLSQNMNDSMMEMENHFLIAPVAHKCEITLC